MKNLVSISVLVCLFFSSCSKDKQSEPLINYKGSAFIKIESSSVHDSIYVETKIISQFPMGGRTRKNVLITNAGIMFLQTYLTKPELVEFTINTSNTFRTYLIPNDTLNINFSQSSLDSIHYTTTYSSNNPIFKYYQAKHDELGYFQFLDESALGREYWFRMKISKDLYNKGLMVVDSLENQDNSFLDKNSHKLPNWFVLLERSNIQYSAAYCKILLFGDLYDFRQKEDLKITAPLYNLDTELSSIYYSFLMQYFLYGYPPENDFIIRMINIFKETEPLINSSLKSNIREYFVTCYISDLFSFCESEDEYKNVNSFYTSKDFNISTAGKNYIDQRKQDFLDRRILSTKLDSGTPAPDFEIKDANEIPHKLSDLKGKMIYLHFWATWCGPCKAELPLLNELINKLDSKKVIIVNVCLDNSIYKFKKIIAEERLLGLNLMCDESWSKRLTNFYNISSIPHYTFIDENGLIIRNNCDRPGVIYDYINARLIQK